MNGYFTSCFDAFMYTALQVRKNTWIALRRLLFINIAYVQVNPTENSLEYLVFLLSFGICISSSFKVRPSQSFLYFQCICNNFFKTILYLRSRVYYQWYNELKSIKCKAILLQLYTLRIHEWLKISLEQNDIYASPKNLYLNYWFFCVNLEQIDTQ